MSLPDSPGMALRLPGSRRSAAPFTGGPAQCRPCTRLLRRAPPAAAAAAASAGGDTTAGAASLLAPAYATAGLPGTPRLVNRQLRVNPLTTLVDEISAYTGAADLWFAAKVDRQAWAPGLAVAAAVVLALGFCNPITMLSSGLPQGLQTVVWRGLGWDTEGLVWAVLAAAAGLPFAAYAARSWLTVTAALSGRIAAALPRLRALQGRPGAAKAAAAVAGSRGVAWALGAARLWLVAAAAHGAAKVAAAKAAMAPLSLACTVAAAVGAVALAFAPQVLAAVGALGRKQQQQQQQQQQQPKGPSTASLGALTVGLETAWVLTAAAAAAGPAPLPWAPLAAAAAAAGAAALAGVHSSLLVPRTKAVAAVEGDEALIQVKIRLDSSPVAFDDTRKTLRSGLRVRVGGPPAGSKDLVSEQTLSAVLGRPPAGDGLGRLALDAVAAAPGSHWLPLVPLIEAALPGALLGETVSVPFINGGPGVIDPNSLAEFEQEEAAGSGEGKSSSGGAKGAAAAGAAAAGAAAATTAAGEAGSVPPLPELPPLYRSRDFCWWQPLSDVTSKFGGRVPEAGEAFLYPVNSEGAWLWTAVRAVGASHVELDANLGTEGQRLIMEVEVVEITRGGAAGGGGGASTGSR